MGVRDIVAEAWALAADVTHSSHGCLLGFDGQAVTGYLALQRQGNLARRCSTGAVGPADSLN